VATRDIDRPSYEIDSPYINAPSWPWSLMGYVLCALHVLFFLVAWMQRTA